MCNFRYCCSVNQPTCVTFSKISLESDIQDRDQAIDPMSSTIAFPEEATEVDTPGDGI